MADNIRQAPSATLNATEAGDADVNSQTSLLGLSPQSRREHVQANIRETSNEKHKSTGLTTTIEEVDAESQSSHVVLQVPQPQSTDRYQDHPDIQEFPGSSNRNTGNWTDASNTRHEYNVDTKEVVYDDGIDWRTGYRSRFPWVGFAGLMTIIVATALAVAILGLSNKKRVKDWPFEKYPVQPNVLLNIANQVQNLGLITMVGQGLAIAWWRQALKGSSLNTLHRNHAYSYSFYSIITSGKHFNLIALAALMTKFAVVDSTLFQKATKTVITQQVNYTNASVTAWIETKWPEHKGGIPGDEGNIKTVDAAWASVLEAYSGKVANGKLHDLLGPNASFFGCDYRQECSGAIKGIGFAFNCTTNTEDVDYGLQRQTQQGGVMASYPLWDIRFTPNWATDSNPRASIRLDMLYVDSHAGTKNGSCPGTRTRRMCDMRPAVVQYPVTVMKPSREELAGENIVVHVKFFNDNRTWPLGSPLESEQIDELKVLEYTDLQEEFNTVSTVGALTYVLNNLYSSSANLTYENDWDIASRGSQAQTVFYADNDIDDHSRCFYDIDKTGRDDPAIEILRKVNMLSFVTGLYLNGAPTTDVKARADRGMAQQTIETAVTGIVEEYSTNFSYVAGALVATLTSVLLVLPVYWGFWQLGRKVTLAPLEVSHAFNAPILAPDQTKNYHGDFDEVLHDVGKRRVQYGQLVGAPPGQMGLAEPHKVAAPNKRKSMNVLSDRSNRRMAAGAVFGGVAAAIIGGGSHK
jgi:hypothetical protein